MPNTLPIRLEFDGLPSNFAAANPDALMRASFNRTRLVSDLGYTIVMTGTTLPSTNVGPFILEGSASGGRALYLWNDSQGQYTPAVPRSAGFRATSNSTQAFTANNTWTQVTSFVSAPINIEGIFDVGLGQAAIAADEIGYWHFEAQVPLSYVSGATTSGTFAIRLVRIYGSPAVTDVVAQSAVSTLTGITSGSQVTLALSAPLVLATLNDNYAIQVIGNNGTNQWQVQADTALGWFSGYRISV